MWKSDQNCAKNRPQIDIKINKNNAKCGLGGSKIGKNRILEPSWPQVGAGRQKGSENLIRWTPWALQLGGQNSTIIVKKTIQNLIILQRIFWIDFLRNLMPTWCQVGSQNLPKMTPSSFPTGVQQANRQNKQNMHGAQARARFSMVSGSQVGTKIH